MRQTGPPDAERRDILTLHGRSFAKSLRVIGEEIERTEGVIERLLDGEQPTRGEMPYWLSETTAWLPSQQKTAMAKEPDPRDPAVLLAELQGHLAERKQVRATIPAHRDRATTLQTELDELRQQAQRILSELLDPQRGMKWSQL